MVKLFSVEKWPFARSIGYTVGLLVFVAIGFWGGRQAVLAPFHPRFLPLLLCFIANGFLFLLSGLRWATILNRFENHQEFELRRYMYYFLLSRFAGEYISTLGSDLVVRPLMLRGGDNLPLQRGFGSVLMDKSFDLLFVFMLLIPAILIMLEAVPPAWLIAISVLALALPWTLILDNRLLPSIIRVGLRLVRHVGGRIPILREKLPPRDDLQEAQFDLLNRRILSILLGLTLLKYGALVLRLVFLVEALNLSIPVGTIWAGIPIAQLSLLLAFTPGGLGILEGGWYAVLSVMGLGSDAISSFLIGQRLYWLAFSAVFALVGYVGLMVEHWLRTSLQKEEH